MWNKISLILWIAHGATATAVDLNPSGGNEPMLEESIFRYIGSTDTHPSPELRRRIQSQENELKPLLLNILDNYEISDPSYDYGVIAMLPDLSSGLEDKEFDLDFWRKVMMKHKDFTFGTPGFFYRYWEHDPDGAEETFRKLLEIGSDDIKDASRIFLGKIQADRLKQTSDMGFPKNGSNSNAKKLHNSTHEDSRKVNSRWYIIGLGGIGFLGMIAVWFSYRRRTAP